MSIPPKTQDLQIEYRRKEADDFYMKIIDYLVEYRKNNLHHMNKSDLGEKLGVNPSTSMRIETGEIKISLIRFFEICSIYNLKPENVLHLWDRRAPGRPRSLICFTVFMIPLREEYLLTVTM